MQYYKDDNDQ